MNDLMLNARPAPYRRDLTGEDLRYEFRLLMAKHVKVGDVLTIPKAVLIKAGPGDWPTPPWPWRMWEEPDGSGLKVQRLPDTTEFGS